ncbi:MAG TPA: hypothetical protein VE442_17005 [Jatrophihabitans sp.]|jgi:Mce-associated membrane protein|nr:hypothetical protein [Jatrophihabitans sp.]
MTEKIEERADAPTEADEPTPKAKPSKAERLEAKAARLREAEERRAAAVGTAPTPRRWVIGTAVLGAVTTVLVAALVVALLAWQHQRDTSHGWRAAWQQQRDGGAARTSAVAAAKSFALDFGSYDYRSLDTHFKEVAALMTPGFRKSFLATSTKLTSTFEQFKTHVTARIEGSGLTSASPSRAVAVVFLDQTVHTSQSSTPRLDRNRLEIHLVRGGDKWLVSKLLAK